MESSSNSTTPPNPSPSLELEIHRLKRMFSTHRGFLLHLDEKGGQRFEMTEEYLIHLREEVVEGLTYTTQQANNKIVDLKQTIEKLEIQASGQSRQIDAEGKVTTSARFSIPSQKV
jgi:hypothetical protein